MTILIILLIIINTLLACLNYELKNYKTALFSAFVSGFIFNVLLHQLYP